MHAIASAVFVVTGCAYQAGSFHSEAQSFVGAHASAGCLDFAIDRRPDIEHRAVLAYAFGNLCDRPTVVDLASATVVARGEEEAAIHLEPYDPRHEIVERALDGRAVGGEAIAYPLEKPANDICVDAASIAHITAPVWLCFASPTRTEDL